MFMRLEIMFDENKMSKLKNATVGVVGLGGVGGYVVEMLVRCGVGNLVIIDYDRIELSNINRQIIATSSNVGCDKVDAWVSRILDINPSCNVVGKKMFLDNSNIDALESCDIVVDCCDTFSSKCDIIRYCLDHNISFVSSMGAGNKYDGSLFKIMDLRKTSYDPIAKKLRKWVKDNNIKGKIPVCSSSSEVLKSRGSVGSISYVVASCGIVISSYVVSKIVS